MDCRRSAARALAERIGVPTLPGTKEPISDRDEALRAKARLLLGGEWINNSGKGASATSATYSPRTGENTP